MTVHANSLANLCPPWQAGVGGKSGDNPVHPSHGSSLIECINEIGDWTRAKLQALADDEAAPVLRRKAAKSHLRSMEDDFAKSGKPLAMDDLHLHLDYTDGKPVQRVETVHTEVRDPARLREELIKAMAATPGLWESLCAAGVLPCPQTDPVPGGAGSDAGEGGGAPKRA